jgi:WhiB family transcriptional regulator, redox-sensing transcriptional regulator
MTTIDHQSARPVTDNWDWQLFAACRGLDVDIFYHPYGERRRDKEARISQAKQICQACPVISECAAWALTTREPYGVWGGMSEDERADMLGLRNLRYPAAAPTPNGAR